MIYWLTGQPGSGKTVLGNLLKDYLEDIKNDKDNNRGYKAFRIDGDEMRELFANKDYSEKGRRANIDAAQKIAHYLHNQGKDVIVSLVSPYRDQREEFKNILGEDIKEYFIHYDISQEKRGREHFHVKEYKVPTDNFTNINTTKDNPLESLKIIVKEIDEKI